MSEKRFGAAKRKRPQALSTSNRQKRSARYRVIDEVRIWVSDHASPVPWGRNRSMHCKRLWKEIIMNSTTSAEKPQGHHNHHPRFTTRWLMSTNHKDSFVSSVGSYISGPVGLIFLFVVYRVFTSRVPVADNYWGEGTTGAESQAPTAVPHLRRAAAHRLSGAGPGTNLNPDARR